MDFELKPLPYAASALEPHIGRQTVEVHHERHHAGCLAKLEALIEDTPAAEQSLETIIPVAEGAVFETAAEVWNHDFYWRSMKPGGGGEPGDPLHVALAEAFGNLAGFRRAFVEAGASHFGSGWLWLVHYAGRLRLLTTPDADLPLVYHATALLAVDLWEHAYYLDYRDERTRYLEAFVDHLVDWNFAAANYRREIDRRAVDLPDSSGGRASAGPRRGG